MKKLSALFILLSVIGLTACGGGSTDSEDDARDNCTENPALCDMPEPEIEPEI